MAETGANCCSTILNKIQATTISKDELGKAKSFRLFSIARPHMRGFHTAWFCFFIAFTAWFGIQPLIPTIRKELHLSKVIVAHSGTASISATIFVRIVVGPLCDRFGPRRIMSTLLIAGSIPLAFSGLIRSGIGLIVLRLCIGVLGGCFIPCQFWTSAMFNVKIVGTANALVGGWGNLGGGFTFILMPALFELVKACGAGEFLAWKIAVIIPAVVVLGMGVLILWTSDDCPQGHWSNRKLPGQDKTAVEVNDATAEGKKKYEYKEGIKNVAFEPNEVIETKAVNDVIEHKKEVKEDGSELEKDSKTEYVKEDIQNVPEDGRLDIWLYITVVILLIQYGLCFGVEIAVNTVMNLYFLYAFKKDNCTEGTVNSLVNTTNMTTMIIPTTTDQDSNECSILSQNTASLIASLFGLTNLFARALGGIFSDVLRKYFGISGRLLAHFICLTGEGVLLIIFSRMTVISSAIMTMVVFSLFVQSSEGSTFAIVPYVHPRKVGIVAGLVGAGGNAGAMIWNTVWSQMVDNDPSRWFWTLGICVLCGNILTLFVPIQNERIWNLKLRKRG